VPKPTASVCVGDSKYDAHLQDIFLYLTLMHEPKKNVMFS